MRRVSCRLPSIIPAMRGVTAVVPSVVATVAFQRGAPPPPGRGQQQQFEQRMPPQQGGRGMPPQAQQQRMPPPTEDAEPPQEPPQPPKKPEGTPKFLTVETSDKGITTIMLNRGPVNSLSLEVLSELNDWLMWLSYTDETKGLVLSSKLSMVFSAGLDINELHKPKEDRFKQFWSCFQETWTVLNSYPKPIVAAINGNSPAGGCILAISCDLRVMARSPAGQPTKPYRIGLNESKIGMIAPPWVMNTFSYVLGSRKAERLLQLGETPTADEALAIGLVDIVVEEGQVLEVATKELEKFIAIPESARWMTRDMMRRDLVQFMSTEEERNYDVEFFWNMLQNPDVQGNIGKYLERLSGGKKKQ